MVLERIIDPVAVDRHVALERGVAPLELEMLLDHLCERQASVQGHANLPLRRLDRRF
jgi:hypothetical protein